MRINSSFFKSFDNEGHVFKKKTESASHGGKSDLTLKKKKQTKLRLEKLIQKCDCYQLISL